MSLQFKRSRVKGVVADPSLLLEGELAINLVDKRLFTLDHTGRVIDIGTSRDYVDQNFLRTNGGVITGRLELADHAVREASDIGINEFVTKRFVDGKFGTGVNEVRTNGQLDDQYIKKAGDTVDSALSITYAPTAGQHVINKSYADGKFVPLVGGTITGNISTTVNPTSSQHLISRGYADSRFLSASATSENALLLNGMQHTEFFRDLDDVAAHDYDSNVIGMQEFGTSGDTTVRPTGIAKSSNTRGVALTYNDSSARLKLYSEDKEVLSDDGTTRSTLRFRTGWGGTINGWERVLMDSETSINGRGGPTGNSANKIVRRGSKGYVYGTEFVYAHTGKLVSETTMPRPYTGTNMLNQTFPIGSYLIAWANVGTTFHINTHTRLYTASSSAGVSRYYMYSSDMYTHHKSSPLTGTWALRTYVGALGNVATGLFQRIL